MQGVPIVLAPGGDLLDAAAGSGSTPTITSANKRLAEAVCSVVLANALRRTIHRIEMHRREHGRNFRPVFHVPGDRFVSQLREVVSPPVPLETGNEQWIE